MAKPKLASLHIYPGAKGHRVVHEFERKPTYSRTQGMSMAGPQQEEHNFGPGDKGALLKHITSALALGGAGQAAGAGQAGGGGQPEE